MPARTRKKQNGRSLLSICLDIHMQNTGASDQYQFDVKGYKKDLTLLRIALDNWEHQPIEKFLDFDCAVYDLISATIDESYHNELFLL